MAFLADEANLSQEGKLNALGVFDRIDAAAFPIAHPRMVFVFRVHAEPEDSGETFPIGVRLVNDDGETLFEAHGELVAPDVAPGEFSVSNQIFTLVGVQFPQPGVYRFLVEVGDLEMHETPFVVAQGIGAPGTLN
ncbi:hypothetical protein BH20GEM2_BH20GEM2_18610 [soil metagenome]|jgi:hypothetical protein